MNTENCWAEAQPLQMMESEKPNAELVWKQFEDELVPRLRFTVTDRAVYSHLVRHSRLEGKRQLHFSLAWLARGTRLCDGAVRPAVGRLIDHGALRLVERSKSGHVVEVLLPDEIPAAGQLRRAVPRPRRAASGVRAQFLPQPGVLLPGVQFEERSVSCRGLSPSAVPRGPLDRQGINRPARSARGKRAASRPRSPFQRGERRCVSLR